MKVIEFMAEVLPSILVIDDDEKFLRGFERVLLQTKQFHVISASNGTDGLKHAQSAIPNLIVLDKGLPDIDGLALCRLLRDHRQTSHIPILMLTAADAEVIEGLKCANDYVLKGTDNLEILARIIRLIESAKLSPYLNSEKQILRLWLHPEEVIYLRIEGKSTFVTKSTDRWIIDQGTLERQAAQVAYVDPRFSAKQMGTQLYKTIFESHPHILGAYTRLLGKTPNHQNLHLRFETKLDLIRLLFESLYDIGSNKHLALEHPISLLTTNVETQNPCLSAAFLNELWMTKSNLRILLIASDTPRDIPGVDEEIKLLENIIPKLFEPFGINVEIEAIFTFRASLDFVRQKLQNCQYHIIHYAGHSTYDVHSPENSSLRFWTQNDRQGEVKSLSAIELHNLLRNSQTRFVYLSSCRGAQTGATSQLLDDSFLGISDAIIQAGIPSLLSYRWAVSNRAAELIARNFYGSLAKTGHLDSALLEARRKVAELGMGEVSWLAPVLFMQE